MQAILTVLIIKSFFFSLYLATYKRSNEQRHTIISIILCNNYLINRIIRYHWSGEFDYVHNSLSHWKRKILRSPVYKSNFLLNLFTPKITDNRQFYLIIKTTLANRIIWFYEWCTFNQCSVVGYHVYYTKCSYTRLSLCFEPNLLFDDTFTLNHEYLR